MERQYAKMGETDFGAEVAKILPLIMREFTKRSKSIFSELPLTIPQIVVLEFLTDHGPRKMNELATALHVTMSAVTVIVDKMIKLKLVKRERSSEDRRVVNVILLNKGRETARRIKDARRNLVNELFSTVTVEDRQQYLRILRKVYKNLRRRA